MLGPADVISKPDEVLADDPPRPPPIEPLEISDVLENHVLGAVLLENLHDLVGERPANLIARATAISGLGERLTGKSGAQNVMRRYLVDAFAQVAMDCAVGIREILEVQVAKFRIDLRSEDALVAQVPESTMEAPNSRKEVDKLHRGRAPARATGAREGVEGEAEG